VSIFGTVDGLRFPVATATGWQHSKRSITLAPVGIFEKFQVLDFNRNRTGFVIWDSGATLVACSPVPVGDISNWWPIALNGRIEFWWVPYGGLVQSEWYVMTGGGGGTMELLEQTYNPC